MFGIVSGLRKRFMDSQVSEILARGDAARDGKRWAAAAAAYREYVLLRPHDDGIWVQLGHALKESGYIDQANTAYEHALSIDPAKADTHLQLGHVRKLMGRLHEAAAAYKRAAELDPANPWAKEEFAALEQQLLPPPALEPPPMPELAPEPPTPTPAQLEATLPITHPTHPAATPEALAPSTPATAALETQVRLLASQLRAVRVLSGELLKTRRESEVLRARVEELERAGTTERAQMEARLLRLEAQIRETLAQSPTKPLTQITEYLASLRSPA